MTQFQKCISAVTLAGMRVTPHDHHIGDMQKYLKRSGFSQVEVTDLTAKIQPSLHRLARVSKFYFRHPRLARVLRRHISDFVTMNSISGYLMELTFDGQTIHQYNQVIAKKSASDS